MLHATTHVKLHMPLLTMNNFAQQIITSKQFSFEFLYSLINLYSFFVLLTYSGVISDVAGF